MKKKNELQSPLVFNFYVSKVMGADASVVKRFNSLKVRQDASSLNSARQRFYMWLVADLCVQRMVILSSTRAQQCHFAGLSGKKATKAIQSLNGSTNKNTHLNRGGYFVLRWLLIDELQLHLILSRAIIAWINLQNIVSTNAA